MKRISRRTFLRGAGAVAVAVAMPACQRGREPETRERRYAFLDKDEAAFVEVAVARLIPADEAGPGALEAGVPFYIDRQLAGEWGAGAGLYRAGPWARGREEQGYQLPFTPAELFRNALRAIVADLKLGGLANLATAAQDDYLRALERESRDLNGVPSNVFFESLLELTIEGFFADPVYGGNRDMIGWRLVGFPGAYANYYELVDQHGIAFTRPPMSLGQDARGVVHLYPVRPDDGAPSR